MIKFESLNHYPNVWLTSDTHYSHKNICRGVSGWRPVEDDPPTWRRDTYEESVEEFYHSTRDFPDVDAMNSALVHAINEHVGEDDLLIHCGDWAFGGREKIQEFRERLTVRDIFAVCGNHDHNILYGNVPSPFTRFEHLYYLQYKGQQILACHYPINGSWHQSHKGARHAFGHVHGSMFGNEVGKSMDVGVDAAYRLFGSYRPFSFNEFVGITNMRDTIFLSHHNPKTN